MPVFDGPARFGVGPVIAIDDTRDALPPAASRWHPAAEPSPEPAPAVARQSTRPAAGFSKTPAI